MICEKRGGKAGRRERKGEEVICEQRQAVETGDSAAVYQRSGGQLVIVWGREERWRGSQARRRERKGEKESGKRKGKMIKRNHNLIIIFFIK